MKHEQLPHNTDAERLTLGSMLLNPDVIGDVDLSSLDFYHTKHAEIFQAICKTFKNHATVDAVLVRNTLDRTGKLEKVGGEDFLLDLTESIPTSANVRHYAGLVKSAAQRRRLKIKLIDLIQKTDDDGVTPQDISDLSGISLPGYADTTPIDTPRTFLEYNYEDDENTLLGSRWLCRSGSALLIGQTGLGKSAFAIQAACTWATGQDLFGMQPRRPLTSLILQTENDPGDMAEMFQGVANGTGLANHVDEIDRRIWIVSDASKCGDEFLEQAESLIAKLHPDLVWIEPLFAFVGGNISEQESITKFCRAGLQRIANKTGVAWIAVHHTNKPPKDIAKSNTSYDNLAYEGSGSSELANWARATMILRSGGSGTYELVCAKRRNRATFLDSDGNRTDTVYLRHGEGAIYWQRAPEPEDEHRAADNDAVNHIMRDLNGGEQFSTVEVRDKIKDFLQLKGVTSFYQPGKRAYRIYHAVISRLGNRLNSEEITTDEI